MKSNVLMKRDKLRQTGAEGTLAAKWTELEACILDVLGRDSPAVEGLEIPESPAEQLTMQQQRQQQERQQEQQQQQINSGSSTQNLLMTDRTGCSRTLKRQRQELEWDEQVRELKLMKLRMELRESELRCQKLELETEKLRRELHQPKDIDDEEAGNLAASLFLS
uniref:BMERB domain-containing protein n=1 Tax=Macrostomum lignano TaxID=282301 RepID=A0A1I8IHV7_9PLAT